MSQACAKRLLSYKATSVSARISSWNTARIMCNILTLNGVKDKNKYLLSDFNGEQGSVLVSLQCCRKGCFIFSFQDNVN